MGQVARPDGARRVALIVDDDDDIRDALGQILDDEGWAVATAANGREALDYLLSHRASPPDVILLDLMMPVMNGGEFRVEQLKDPSLARIPVVVISAGDERHRIEIVDARGYLQKPINIDELIDLVQAA